MERHVDDAGLHAGDDVDLAAELTAGKHLDAYRPAGLGGDQLGKHRRHRLGRMQRGIRVAELEGDGALGIGAIWRQIAGMATPAAMPTAALRKSLRVIFVAMMSSLLPAERRGQDGGPVSPGA